MSEPREFSLQNVKRAGQAPSDRFQQARDAFNRRQYREALRILEEALEHPVPESPDAPARWRDTRRLVLDAFGSPEALLLRGKTLYHLGRYRAARLDLGRAARFTQTTHHARYALATLAMVEERFEYASRLLKRLLEDTRRNVSFQAHCHGRLSTCALLLGRPVTAASHREEAKKADLISSDLLIQYGRSLQHEGLWDEAAAYYGEAVNADPTNAQAYFLLANLFALHQHYGKAEEILAFGLEHAPEEILFFTLLGDLRSAQEKFADAVTLYRLALEISPKGFNADALICRVAHGLYRLGKLEDARSHYLVVARYFKRSELREEAEYYAEALGAALAQSGAPAAADGAGKAARAPDTEVAGTPGGDVANADAAPAGAGSGADADTDPVGNLQRPTTAATAATAAERRQIERFPGGIQPPDWCGPKILASLLQHFGVFREPETIAAETFADGVEWPAAINYLSSQGFRTWAMRGSRAVLAQLAAAEIPALVSLYEGLEGHYVAVLGIDPIKSCVIVQDPSFHEPLDIPWPEFERAWATTSRLTLVALPSDWTDLPDDLVLNEDEALGHWLLAVSARASGDAKTARRAAIAARAAAPTDCEAAQKLLVELDLSGDDAPAAAERAEAVLAGRPKTFWALKYRGDSALAREAFAEALDWYRRAWEVERDDASLWAARGAAHFARGHLIRARQSLRRALELVPRDALVEVALGEVLAAEGRIAEAGRRWEIALELDDSCEEAAAYLQTHAAAITAAGGATDLARAVTMASSATEALPSLQPRTTAPSPMPGSEGVGDTLMKPTAEADMFPATEDEAEALADDEVARAPADESAVGSDRWLAPLADATPDATPHASSEATSQATMPATPEPDTPPPGRSN